MYIKSTLMIFTSIIMLNCVTNLGKIGYIEPGGNLSLAPTYSNSYGESCDKDMPLSRSIDLASSKTKKKSWNNIGVALKRSEPSQFSSPCIRLYGNKIGGDK